MKNFYFNMKILGTKIACRTKKSKTDEKTKIKGNITALNEKPKLKD